MNVALWIYYFNGGLNINDAVRALMSVRETIMAASVVIIVYLIVIIVASAAIDFVAVLFGWLVAQAAA